MRGIDFLAGFQFDFPNPEHMPGALVQQIDNLRIELVNGLPMFGNIHDGVAEDALKKLEANCADCRAPALRQLISIAQSWSSALRGKGLE